MKKIIVFLFSIYALSYTGMAQETISIADGLGLYVFPSKDQDAAT